jgi:hypothetical protein
MKKLFFSFLTCFIAISAISQEQPTYEIHAAMLYNFIKYIQWPDESESGDFVIGVIGEERVFNTLKEWYDGKVKGTKKYVIRRLGSAEEARDCQVVYVGKSMNKDFDMISASTTGKSVLTITDGIDLGHKGSCINFRVIDGKLKFELNEARVASSNLKVSSQLSSMGIVI